MRFLIVFLIIVLCVSIGGPLLRHRLLTEEAADEAPAAAIAVHVAIPAETPPPVATPLVPPPVVSQESEQTEPADKESEQPATTEKDRIETFSMLGEIVDLSDGKPIPNVQVLAVRWNDTMNNPHSIFNLNPKGMGMTDAAGRFEITGLREAPYGVVAHHETYIQTEAVTKFFLGPDMDEERAMLTMEEGGVVMGQVSFQGKLLPGQQIRLAYPYGLHEAASVSTDVAGAYVFEGLRPGHVKVATSTSTGAGLIETSFTVRVESGRTTILDLPIEGYDATISGQVIPYDPGFTYVVTAVSNETSGDDFVYTSNIDPDGTYSFVNMPFGRFRIVVDARKDKIFMRRGQRHRLQAIVRTFPGLEARHDFYFSDGFTAEGYVPNVAPNEPLTVLASKSMRITNFSPSVLRVLHEATSTYYAFVDVNGGFRFDALPPGTYQIIAEGGPNRYGLATIHVASRPSRNSGNQQPLAPLELWLEDN